jgi:hypothetical protein
MSLSEFLKRKCLKVNNWISATLNTVGKQNMLKMFGRKRKNKGMMWASLLGLGVSAAAYGLGRNRKSNMLGSVQNAMNSILTRTANRVPNTMTEFSKELLPDPLTNKNK